jgi:antitoxin component YwqK of YwqJK toxin-antitoxin module
MTSRADTTKDEPRGSLLLALVLVAEAVGGGLAAVVAGVSVLQAWDVGLAVAVGVAGVAAFLGPIVLAVRASSALARSGVGSGGRRVAALALMGAAHACVVAASLTWGGREESHLAQAALDTLKVTGVGVPVVITQELSRRSHPEQPRVVVEQPVVPDGGPVGAEGGADGGEAPPRKVVDVRYPPRPRPIVPGTFATGCPPGTRAQKGQVAAAEDSVEEGFRRLRTGTWKYCVLPNGFLHGPSVQWHPNGTGREVASFKDGLKDGSFSRWTEKGRLVARGTYAADQKVGRWEEWADEPGSLDEDVAEVHALSEGDYAGGRRHGTWTTWTERCIPEPPDQLCYHSRVVTSWKEGKLDGPWARVLERGQETASGFHAHGQPDGPWTGRYADGTTRFSRRYAQGRPAGTWKRYCLNGQLLRQESFDGEGRRDGPITVWFQSGAKRWEGTFSAGQPDGRWVSFAEDGAVLGTADFNHGVLVNGAPLKLDPPACKVADKALAKLMHRKESTAPAGEVMVVQQGSSQPAKDR